MVNSFGIFENWLHEAAPELLLWELAQRVENDAVERQNIEFILPSQLLPIEIAAAALRHLSQETGLLSLDSPDALAPVFANADPHLPPPDTAIRLNLCQGFSQQARQWIRNRKERTEELAALPETAAVMRLCQEKAKIHQKSIIEFEPNDVPDNLRGKLNPYRALLRAWSLGLATVSFERKSFLSQTNPPKWQHHIIAQFAIRYELQAGRYLVSIAPPAPWAPQKECTVQLGNISKIIRPGTMLYRYLEQFVIHGALQLRNDELLGLMNKKATSNKATLIAHEIRKEMKDALGPGLRDLITYHAGLNSLAGLGKKTRGK